MRKHETTFNDGGRSPVFTVAQPDDEYKEDVQYDANGNISKYIRSAIGSNLGMDSLDYDYYTGTNRLKKYHDNPAFTNSYTEDVDEPSQDIGDFYTYDRIGNLIKDEKEGIDKIEWTVYGKISKIMRFDLNSPNIEYEYDAGGNRIFKKVTVGMVTNYTYYVRDAQGNTLAVYTRTDAAAVKWAEQHLYDSSRIGMMTPDIVVPSSVSIPTPGNTLEVGFDYGQTFYELSNHLGNVLATISDKKIGMDEAEYTEVCVTCPPPVPGVITYCGGYYDLVTNSPDGLVDYFKADVITQTAYYPFGMQMPGRIYRATTSYRYGFNGKENDNEVL